MSATSRRFELVLPGMTLACGATLQRLVVRGHHQGPAADAAALEKIVDLHPAHTGGERLVARSVAAQEAIAPPRPGRLPAGPPTVVCIHALTADSRVGGDGGWWSDRVGPGLPLDPRLVRVLCFNNLGSCYGTSGPADEDFPRLSAATASWPSDVTWTRGRFTRPADALPAPVTTWDQARAQILALDALGIDRVDLLIGGSVGGMVALAMAALAPERFPAVVPIATLDRATPWIIGWNHIARQMIGDALGQGTPEDAARALSVARQVAHMTYRSSAGLMERHGRGQVGTETWSANAPYRVQTYLAHQGDRLVERFDPRAYIAQLDAMDHHDLSVSPPRPDPHESWTLPEGDWLGLERLTARLDAIAIDTDELFFARDLHALIVRYRALGRNATWTLLRSLHGHDAFLMPSRLLDDTLRAAVRRIDPERFP